jgi:hypothetical protein
MCVCVDKGIDRRRGTDKWKEGVRERERERERKRQRQTDRVRESECESV